MISLLGGVALFLFGMTLMGDGLKKVAGNKLEIILYKLTSTPLKGVLLGTGVTAVIQSSSATSVMVVGFVNSGMMQVRQAIGIVLGSILGTSITGWILCLSDISGSGWVSLLSTATLTGVVAVVGIVLRMFCKDLTKHHIGDILLGFAVLMYGMSSMSGAVAPLKDSATFIQLLTRFSNPLLGVLVGAVVTGVKNKKDKLFPGKLYSLSKLQSVLGKKYKMSMQESLALVQGLYEKGYLTYPRTNSEYLATAEKDKIRQILAGCQKIGYPVKFKDSKTIFDDSKIESHSALTPTYKIPQKAQLTEREMQVYSTVFRRFVAVFCAEDCVVSRTEITIDVGDLETFVLKGMTVLEKGWTKYDDFSQKDKILPRLEKGDISSRWKRRPPRRGITPSKR